MRKKPRQPEKRKSVWPWLVLAAAMLFSTAVRIRLLGIPLERDEGEFAYMGQLMLYGIAPYDIAYNMKMPGIYAAYALIMALFGQTTAGIHIGLLLVNLGCIYLTFTLSRRLFGLEAAAMAAVAYALLSLSPNVNGTSAHATHFVALFALAGLVLVLKASETERPGLHFLSGIMFGLAFLMKQPGAVFALLGLGLIAWNDFLKQGRRPGAVVRVGLFVLGCLLPFAVTLGLLWKAGVLDTFVFWTVTYCREYATMVPAREAWEMFVAIGRLLLRDTWPVYLTALAGLVALAAANDMRPRLPFVLGFFLCSLAAVSAGFYFRQHYYIAAFPCIAVMAGAAAGWARTRTILAAALALFTAFAWGYAVSRNLDFWFKMPVYEASRSMYGANPFPESVEIANYIKKRTTARDTILVIGSEPQIYFYAGRLAAAAYIYMYPLMEVQPYARSMQMAFIRQAERARPKYVVLVRISTSWLGKEKSETLVLQWIDSFLQNYRRVGLVDIIRSDTYWTQYYWGADSIGRNPTTDCHILVFERVRN